MLIRPEQPEDFEAINEVNRLAFERDNEAQLIERLRDREDYHPGLSLVAVAGKLIVGHILFSPIVIVSGSKRVPALALAPLAVRPNRQQQGIGTELVEQGLAACRKLGHHIVVVLGHPELYPRFGFKLASKCNITAPFPVPDEAFMVLGLTPGALVGVEGMVEYPEPFNEVE